MSEAAETLSLRRKFPIVFVRAISAFVVRFGLALVLVSGVLVILLYPPLITLAPDVCPSYDSSSALSPCNIQQEFLIISVIVGGVLVPIWIFAIWLFGRYERLQKQLVDVVVKNGELIPESQKAGPDYSRKRWKITKIILVLVLLLITVLLASADLDNGGGFDVGAWIAVIPSLFTLFVFINGIHTAFVFMRWVTRVLRDAEFRIDPLAPDRVGGVSFIGSALLGFALYLLIIGGWLASLGWVIFNVTGSLTDGLVLSLFLLVIYGMLVFLLLITPAVAIISAMNRPRQAELRKVTQRRHGGDDNQQLKALSDEMQTIRDTYPVIPIHLSRIQGATVSTLIPLIAILTPLLVGSDVAEILNRDQNKGKDKGTLAMIDDAKAIPNIFPGKPIDLLDFRDTIDTSGADLEDREIQSCGDIGSTVWYHFTPEEDMELTADTFGSTFDTVLAVYDDIPSGSSEVGCNDDILEDQTQSEVSFLAKSGETYFFQVGGFEGDNGILQFQLGGDASTQLVPLDPPPGNDVRPGTLIPVPGYSDSVLTSGATLDADEPEPLCSVIGATVWYHFTPEEDISLTANTFRSDFDTVLAVYEVSPSNEITCSDESLDNSQSEVRFFGSEGVTYLFQVGGFEGDNGILKFELSGSLLAPLSNDIRAESTLIESPDFSASVNTSSATRENGELQPSCAKIGATVWYKFTPNQDMTLTADTLATFEDFDTVLAVYELTSGLFTEVGCSDDISEDEKLSEVSFLAKSGQAYFFQVGGFEGDNGILTFQLSR